MNDLRFENSMKELSIVDLFDTIDNVGKDNNDNDKIIDKIRDQIFFMFSSKLRKKREKEKKEAMLRRYKAYLESFRKLLTEQMMMMDNLIEDDTDDITEEFLNLKKELLEYSIQAYKLDLQDMSEVLNRKEQKVYQCIHFYDLMENYSTVKEKCDGTRKENGNIKSYENQEIISPFPKWKTYYYWMITLEKQRRFDEKIISYYLEKNKEKQDNEFSLELSKYYVADFQGQFSKSIYCQRKRLKLTQLQLQERSGVNRTMIAKIEKVQQPTTLETAIRLLYSLNLGITIYPLGECGESSSNG